MSIPNSQSIPSPHLSPLVTISFLVLVLFFNGKEDVATTTYWVEAKDTVNILQGTEQPPRKELSSVNEDNFMGL